MYGAPETYLIDKQGIIRHKIAGVATVKVWREQSGAAAPATAGRAGGPMKRFSSPRCLVSPLRCGPAAIDTCYEFASDAERERFRNLTQELCCPRSARTRTSPT